MCGPVAGLRRPCFSHQEDGPQGRGYKGWDLLIRSVLQDPPLRHGRLHHHQFGDVLRRE
jgi:hypothetical protein